MIAVVAVRELRDGVCGRLCSIALLALVACQEVSTTPPAPSVPTLTTGVLTQDEDDEEESDQDQLPATRRIAVITSKGLQHVTPEELAALTAETPAATGSEGKGQDPSEHESPYELKLRQNEYESAIEVHPRNQSRPLLIYQIEPGILRVMFSQRRPERDQVPELTAMLQEVMQELQSTFSPSAMVLDVDYVTYPAATERLATLANQDSAYRTIATRLQKDDATALLLLQRYVRHALEGHTITPELDQLVSAFAMRLQASNVESCRAVPRHPEPNLSDWLQDRHLSLKRSLPIHCMVTFDLLPAQSAEQIASQIPNASDRVQTSSEPAPQNKSHEQDRGLKGDEVASPKRL